MPKNLAQQVEPTTFKPPLFIIEREVHGPDTLGMSVGFVCLGLTSFPWLRTLQSSFVNPISYLVPIQAFLSKFLYRFSFWFKSKTNLWINSNRTRQNYFEFELENDLLCPKFQSKNSYTLVMIKLKLIWVLEVHYFDTKTWINFKKATQIFWIWWNFF